MGFGPQIKRNRLVSRGVRTQAALLAISETGVTVQQNYGLPSCSSALSRRTAASRTR
jgi:predicted signal transduction protein with EAL and GGDEF domain